MLARVLAVEIAVVRQQFRRRYFPGVIVLLAPVPPHHALREFLELDGHGLRVVLTPFWRWLFVVPDLLRRPTAVEK